MAGDPAGRPLDTDVVDATIDDEWGDDWEWGDGDDVVVTPSCNLENPDICESCM